MNRRLLLAVLVVLVTTLGLAVPPPAAAFVTATGTIVHEATGLPVAGAAVCASASMGPCSAATGTNGRWSLPLEEGAQTVWVRGGTFDPSSAAPVVPKDVTITVASDGTTSPDPIAVQLYGTVKGTVLDPSGAPVAYATVNACVTSSSCYGPTGPNGEFTLTVLPGTVTVSASGAGFFASSVTLSVGSGETVEGIVIRLKAGATVSGTVTEADGSPVPVGTPVAATVATSNGPQTRTSTTGAGGAYSITGVAAGSLTVSAGPTATGARTTSAPISIELERPYEVNLQLAAGGWIAGTVSPAVPGTYLFVSAGGASGIAYVASDGTYRMPALPSGTYAVSVQPGHPSDYLRATITGVVVVAGQETRLDIALVEGGSISGTVSSGGVAKSGATVEACVSPAMSPCTYAGTGMDGVFTLRGVAPGTYALTASWYEFVPMSPPVRHQAAAGGVMVAAGETTVQDLREGVVEAGSNAQGAVLAGEELSTTGWVTEGNPLVTSVTSAVAGSVSILEAPVPSAGYSLGDVKVEIHAPVATADDPHEFAFTLHPSAYDGVDPLDVRVERNGVVVEPCTDPEGTSASPDPCVEPAIVDETTGVLTIVARTSQASIWTFAADTPPVQFDLSGFFSPVRMGDEVNGARAGRTVPVKFSLGGDRGLDVLAAGSPSSRAVACPSDPSPSAVDEVSGPSALSYDAEADQYVYLWRTSSEWRGCRELVVTFTTGQSLSAVFRFS